MRRRLGFVLACSLAAGGVEIAVSGAQSGEAVTFVVPIDAGRFARGADVSVRLWNADQLKAMERNARCATAYDAETGRETIRCPEGVQYQKVVPEELSFSIRELGNRLSIASRTVRVGESFRIRVSGPSRDGCNTTSAELTGVARSSEALLDELEWETTMKACPDGGL